MKKYALIALATSLLATSAFAKDSYYAKGLIGSGYVPNQKATKVSNSLAIRTKGTGVLGIVGLGYKFGGQNLRSDLEFYIDGGLRGKKRVSGTQYSNKLETMAGLFNFYFDFNNSSKFTPYIQAGAGYARNKTKFTDGSNSYGKTKNGLAYKVGLGLGYSVMKSLDFDLGYFYMNKGAKKTTVGSGSNTYRVKSTGGQIHAFTAGFRLNF